LSSKLEEAEIEVETMRNYLFLFLLIMKLCWQDSKLWRIIYRWKIDH